MLVGYFFSIMYVKKQGIGTFCSFTMYMKNRGSGKKFSKLNKKCNTLIRDLRVAEIIVEQFPVYWVHYSWPYVIQHVNFKTIYVCSMYVSYVIIMSLQFSFFLHFLSVPFLQLKWNIGNPNQKKLTVDCMSHDSDALR